MIRALLIFNDLGLLSNKHGLSNDYLLQMTQFLKRETGSLELHSPNGLMIKNSKKVDCIINSDKIRILVKVNRVGINIENPSLAKPTKEENLEV